MPSAQFHVVVAGGGIAGVEGLLALRDLAADAVQLTLVSPDDAFRLRPFSVAEPFGLGRPMSVPHDRIAADVDAEWRRAAVVAVDDAAGTVQTTSGSLEFDALLLATGGRITEALEHAMTWRPDGAVELFGGLLRDMEAGYVRRVAFVVPHGAVWPLPAYELALMTARQVRGMGVEPEITVVTPEPQPLAVFGSEAADALARALEGVGVRLVTGAVAKVERQPRTQLRLEPSGATIDVDRVVAMPALHGPGLAGVSSDEEGFIRTGDTGRVEGAQRTWAAGDGVVSSLKLGGLATHQARRAARDIARTAGVEIAPIDDDGEVVLHGVLMTGAQPARVDAVPAGRVPGRPIWWPDRKVAGRYLERYLTDGGPPEVPVPSGGVEVTLDARAAQAIERSYLFGLRRAARTGSSP